MATWSGIRHKPESDYLAPCLRGRIQYFCTSYSRSGWNYPRRIIE